MQEQWMPTSSLDVLQKRAFFMSQIRKYFHTNKVLEVETPILSSYGNTDINIESFTSQNISQQQEKSYLRTSPEFPLKRLLCADYGDIYEIGKVFRKGEVGSNHNHEFTMLEWYRVDYSYIDLMNEIVELYNEIGIKFEQKELVSNFITYHDCFKKYLGIEIQNAAVEEMNSLCVKHNYSGSDLSFNACLDYLFSVVIQPNFPENTIQFVTHFPSDQAALAEIDPENSSLSLRFEFYIGGQEIGNGYQELTNNNELKQRFKKDNEFRKLSSGTCVELDSLLLEAMSKGMPRCAGVAVGLDRWLMLLLGEKSIQNVISFSSRNA